MNFQPFCATPKAYVDFMRSKFSELSTLSERECFVYLSLVYANVTDDKRFIHKMHPDCFTICARLLVERLGKNHVEIFQRINIIETAHPYNTTRRATRAYRLNEQAIVATVDFLGSSTEQTSFLFSGKMPILLVKGSTAILSKNGGNTAKCRAYINPIVPIKVPRLVMLINELNREINQLEKSSFNLALLKQSKPYKKLMRRRTSAQRHVYAANNNNHKDLARGEVIQQYAESASGRLYGRDNHLQNSPREVTAAALYGQASYDFENCHFSILAQLCERLSIDTPAINYYLTHKRELRASLADKYGITIQQVKECLLALIYGAALNDMGNNYTAKISAIKDIVGVEIYNKLRQIGEFANIHSEIKQSTIPIIKQHTKPSGITNAVNKSLRPLNKFNDRQKLAHIIQGYEVQMLHIVLNDHGKEISLIQHDGFYSPNLHIDTKALEAKILQQTGFKMLIAKERRRIA